MRSRLTRTGAAAVAVALILSAAACGGGSSSKSTIPGLAAKKLTAGSVDIAIAPRQLDSKGARFAIDLDTHSGDLGIDVARSATLTVGGRPWQPARWSGDGAGGHHRSGTLEFPPGGSASGPVRLVITGLPSPVVAEWPR